MLSVQFREEPHCWVWSERLWCFYGTFAFYLTFVHGTPLTGNQHSRRKVWLSLLPTRSPPPPSSSRILRLPAWSTNLASCPGSFDVDEWPHPTPTYDYLQSIKDLQICQLSQLWPCCRHPHAMGCDLLWGLHASLGRRFFSPSNSFTF